MADSTLMRTGETPPRRQKGHGTAALGPSDSSDSGSDIRGGPGLAHEENIGLASGTTSDPDVAGERGAGADIGDADLDSDSDRFGTGERAAAGRDATQPVDRTLRDERGRVIDGEDIAEETALDAGPGDDETDGGDAGYADLDTTLATGETGDADFDDERGRGSSRDERSGR